MSTGASVKAALGRIPGVRRSKRLAIAAYRRIRPLRPPVESPRVVSRMLVAADDDAFITGNGFAAHCRYVLNYDVFRRNETVENNWWFCNPEFLEYFFRHLAPEEDFVLVTHNSNVDRPIDVRFVKKLRRPELTAWFAANVELRHPKLFSIPLGVGNPVKCDHVELARVQEARPSKSALFEASFDIRTNPAERRYCIEQTGIEPSSKVAPTLFFERLASSCFCISPNGNGVDCYRTWQALYLRTIPIVTRSVLTEQHPELPLIVLDDWSEFRSIGFSPELYEQTWGDWDPASLSLDRYLGRMRATLDRLRGPMRSGRQEREALSGTESVV